MILFPDLFCFICKNGVCKGPNPKKKVEEKDKKRKLKLKRKMLNRTNLSWSTVLNHDLKSADQDSLSGSRGAHNGSVSVRYGSPAFYFSIPWHVLIIRHTLSVIAAVAQRKRQISGRDWIGSPYILILTYIKTFPVLKKRWGCSLKGGGTIGRESAE